MEDNIKLGTPAFAKMMFVLNNPVTEENHKYYRFHNEEMQEIAENIWAMPAYMKADDDFSLFFIITQTMENETVVAFAEGHLKANDFSLGQPVSSGKGLNLLNKHDKNQATEVLHFLNQISKAAEGNWRMIED